MDFFSVIQFSQIDQFLSSVEALQQKSKLKFEFHLLLVDDCKPLKINFAQFPIRTYRPEDISDAGDLIKIYQNRSSHQIACLLKPLFAIFLMKNKNLPRLIFSSPEMYFLSPPDLFWEALLNVDFLLTPHFLASSNIPETALWEAGIATRGLFSPAIMGFRKTPASFEFLNWWHSKIETNCRRDIGQGLYDDQKYLDQAIVEFPGLGIWRDEGYNVAHWNLHQRILRRKNGRLYAGTKPLVCFQFCESNLDQEIYLSRDGRHILEANPELKDLYHEYRERVRKFQWSEQKNRNPVKFIEFFQTQG